MTYAEFNAARRRAVFPEGEAEELVERHKAYVLDALIDLQLKVKCLRRKHYDFIPFDATLWNCGATVFDAPRGYIHGLKTVQACDFCSPVFRYPVTKAQLEGRMTILRNCGGFLAPYGMYEIDGTSFYYPELPFGALYVDADIDFSERPTIGWFALHDNQIWTYPALQSYEAIILEWEGIKRAYNDNDTVEFDQEVNDAVELYLESKARRREDSDYEASASALAAYQVKVGDLIHNCRKETQMFDAFEAEIPPTTSDCTNGGTMLFPNCRTRGTSASESDGGNGGGGGGGGGTTIITNTVFQVYAGTGDPNGVLTPDDPTRPAIYRWVDNANTIMWWDVDAEVWT